MEYYWMNLCVYVIKPYWRSSAAVFLSGFRQHWTLPLEFAQHDWFHKVSTKMCAYFNWVMGKCWVWVYIINKDYLYTTKKNQWQKKQLQPKPCSNEQSAKTHNLHKLLSSCWLRALISAQVNSVGDFKSHAKPLKVAYLGLSSNSQMPEKIGSNIGNHLR